MDKREKAVQTVHNVICYDNDIDSEHEELLLKALYSLYDVGYHSGKEDTLRGYIEYTKQQLSKK